MRERLGYLSRGHIDYGKSSLITSSASVNMTVSAGAVEKGFFELTNSAGFTNMKGLVRSTDSRVRVWDDRFVNGTVKIRYEVNAQFEEAGTAIEGAFQIISSCGEAAVPFCFNVEAADVEHAKGVETIDDFAELARTDEGAAFALFTSPGFIRAPFMKSGAMRTLYSGLTSGAGKRMAMEEFLTGIGAKETIRLSMDTGARTYVLNNGVITDSLTVRKSTWGYTVMEVRSDADFIVFEKSTYNSADFDGDLLSIDYYVDSKKLEPGRNLAKIRVDAPRASFVLDIEVKTVSGESVDDTGAREAYEEYHDLYLNWIMNDESDTSLLNRMQTELNRVRVSVARVPDLVLLQQAEVLALQGRLEDASMILQETSGRVLAEDDGTGTGAEYCYYLYVKQIIDPTEAGYETLIRKLLSYSESNALPDDTIVYLILKLDPLMSSNNSMKLSQMKGWYRMGCRSDFLLLEAAMTAVVSPELIRVLDPFEQDYLEFGVKKGLITEKLAAKLADMAPRMKTPSEKFVHTLMELYEQIHLQELLACICTILIRMDCRDSEYFKWYRRGVDANLRLTGLYEYYVYSVPAGYSEEWPRMVLLYFSYNPMVDDEAGAKLYRYISDNPDSDDELNLKFEALIERFVLAQAAAGHVNAELASLYEDYLTADMIDDSLVTKLPDIVFCHIIRCEDEHVTHAVVCYEELKEEFVFELHDGVAYAPVFTSDARVLTQDAMGIRYESYPVTMTRLMNDPSLTSYCLRNNMDDEMVSLAACERMREQAESPESIAAGRRLLAFPNIHPEFRRKLFSQLTAWYLEHPDAEGSDEYLLSADKRFLTPENRAGVIDLMVGKAMYLEAWHMVERYGAFGMSADCLSRLADIMIMDRLMARDDKVLELAQMSFAAGDNTETVLEYLCCWFNASSADMYELKKRADEAGADTHDLEERLLAQMLFSGETEHLDEIFMAYIAKTSCDEVIIKAFLVVKSWLYVMKGENIDRDIEQYMAAWVDESDMKALPDVCLIALTMSASKKVKHLTDDGIDLCERMIRKLYGAGCLFSYFTEFKSVLALPDDLNDKVIVEYRGESGRALNIVWHMSDETDEREVFNEVFDGVYAIAIPLLYGESIKYDICEMNMGQVLTSGSVKFTGKVQDTGTRTASLNRILEALDNNDDKALEAEMMDYAITDNLVMKCFTPIE